MKTTIVPMTLAVLLSLGAFANPGLLNKNKAKAAPAQATISIEQQLSAQLTYPQSLQGASKNSIVVAQYQIDEMNRISNVQLLTANKQLNRELTRQLTGLRVNANSKDPDQVYTVRLRFQVQ